MKSTDVKKVIKVILGLGVLLSAMILVDIATRQILNNKPSGIDVLTYVIQLIIIAPSYIYWAYGQFNESPKIMYVELMINSMSNGVSAVKENIKSFRDKELLRVYDYLLQRDDRKEEIKGIFDNELRDRNLEQWIDKAPARPKKISAEKFFKIWNYVIIALFIVSTVIIFLLKLYQK